MKKAVLIVALAFSASAVASEHDEECRTEIERASNPVLEILTIPFKVVAAFSHLPRCLVQNFPVND